MKPWDGVYEFDADFTRREWGWIKRLSGYLPGDVDKGFTGVDQELFAVFAIIALYRAGRISPADVSDVWERLQDGGTIRLLGDPVEAEDDAGPPAERSNGNGNSSGNGSTTNSETSQPTLSGHGHPVSATSASSPETLAS